MKNILAISLALVLALGLVIVTSPPQPALAQSTFYVDDDAPNDPGPGNPAISDPDEDGSVAHPFDEIQEGIDAAVSGDTVQVASGTYYENVVVGKRLNLSGTSMPVVDAGGSGTVVQVTADYVNITNFTIRNSGSYGVGIHSTSSHNIFMNVDISNTYVGIFLDSSNYNTIMNSNISGNSELGITLTNNSSYNEINDCTIIGNSWSGINIDEPCQNNQVNDCIISDSLRGIQLSVGSCSHIKRSI